MTAQAPMKSTDQNTTAADKQAAADRQAATDKQQGVTRAIGGRSGGQWPFTQARTAEEQDAAVKNDGTNKHAEDNTPAAQAQRANNAPVGVSAGASASGTPATGGKPAPVGGGVAAGTTDGSKTVTPVDGTASR